MPRLNLSEEEAAAILRWRARHAEDTGFNGGLEEACGVLLMHADSIGGDKTNALQVAIRSMKRPIKLP